MKNINKMNTTSINAVKLMAFFARFFVDNDAANDGVADDKFKLLLMRRFAMCWWPG